MKTFLITGGIGFIGSHVCIILLSKGYKLIVIDTLKNSSRESLNNFLDLVKVKFPKNIVNFKFLCVDIRDTEKLEEIFKNSKESGNPIEGVFHFAGLKSVSESVREPINYWDINVSGTICLIEVMKRFDCKNFIYSSSATVYGGKKNNKISENCLLDPSNPYGQTKAAVEQILSDLNKSETNQWRIAILRYFNPIGAHSSGFIGENPLNKPNNIFPIITRVAAGIFKKLYVYGNDWDTPDGSCIRDYIHVMDVAEGHIVALNYLLKNDPQLLCINLGTGIGTSVIELVETFQRVNKVEIPYSFASRRIGDCPIIVADNNKAKSILNWEPKKNLDEMCKDGWFWQKRQIQK